ncbi:MAG: hypothetical protein ABJX35_01655 [Hyphomicrobiales bacterium]
MSSGDQSASVRSAHDEDEVGFLRAPLKHWNNDDLMLAKATREQVQKDRPNAFRALDWPEMRNLFHDIDEASKIAKKNVRNNGTKAVLIAAFGLALAALATWLLVPGSFASRTAGIVAAALLVGGITMGVWPRLHGHHRSAWLITRLRAERLRQLHFQLLLANFEVAVKAMRDPTDLKELQELRRKALVRFQDRYITPTSTTLQSILNDQAVSLTWHDATWAGDPSSTKDLPQEDCIELLDALHRLRFGVQRYYSNIHVQEHANAPRIRSAWLDQGANLLTIGLVVASLVLAAALILGSSTWEAAGVATTATCAAGIAALRSLEDGLQYDNDARRMGWYLAAIDALDDGYDRQRIPGRLRLHKQLEHVAYREMQEFLITHHRARFLLQ